MSATRSRVLTAVDSSCGIHSFLANDGRDCLQVTLIRPLARLEAVNATSVLLLRYLTRLETVARLLMLLLLLLLLLLEHLLLLLLIGLLDLKL